MSVAKLEWRADGKGAADNTPDSNNWFIPSAQLGSTWYCAEERSVYLRSFALDKGKAWREVVGRDGAKKVFAPSLNARGPLRDEDVLALVACGERLVAVTSFLEVLELAKTGWKRRVPQGKKLRKKGLVAWDPVGQRLVAWGSWASQRQGSDWRFFYEDGTRVLADGEKAWRELAPSAAPPQPKGKPYIQFTMIFDAALGKIVRFGGGGISILDGDRWKNLAPKGWSGADREVPAASGGGWRAERMQPIHDAASGETLVIDFLGGKITRFDVKACAPVGTFPGDRTAVLWTWDAARREIVLHDGRPGFARWRLDIGAAIDAAAKLGPRTGL